MIVPVLGPPSERARLRPRCRCWLERFGTRPARALSPAIHYAEHGFPNTLLVSQAITEFVAGNRDPEWHRIFAPGGVPPAEGVPLVQADLARTLRELGDEGPDLFYRGRVARAIAESMSADGFLTLEDWPTTRGMGRPISTPTAEHVYETPRPPRRAALSREPLEDSAANRASIRPASHY